MVSLIQDIEEQIAGVFAAPANQPAGADRDHGEDPDRRRSARADHRRPRDRQDDQGQRVISGVKAPIAAMKNGQRGWLVRWRDVSPAPVGDACAKLKCSYWYADVDEAMAVYLGLKLGQTFEQAHHELMVTAGCV